MFSPVTSQTASAQRHSGRWSLLALLPVLNGHLGLLTLTIGIGIAARAGLLAVMALAAWIVGLALSGTPTDALIIPLTSLALLVAATAGFHWGQAHVSHHLAFVVIERLQLGLFDGAARGSNGLGLSDHSGALTAVATNDTELMEHFFAHTLADYVGALLIPLVALTGLAQMHPLCALIVLPFVGVVAGFPFLLQGTAYRQGKTIRHTLERLNTEMLDTIQGHRDITVFGRSMDILDRLITRTKFLCAVQKRYAMRAGLEQALIDAAGAAAVLSSAAVGVHLMATGELNHDHLPLVLVLAIGALAPVSEISRTARKLGELRAAASRILAILKTTSPVDDQGIVPLPHDTTLRLQDVCFSYDENRAPVLRGVSMTLNKGDCVALVGRSGAGKSTLVKLLLRFYDVTGGVITIGGQDIASLPLKTLRHLITLVPQESFLFNLTVTENIRLGSPDASRQAVEEAASLAQADSFIRMLPHGYDTLCGEGGALLSAGQRQRISIARAVLTKAPIIIFDEASSNLDVINERALHQALQAIRRTRTLLMIAHRPSTIRDANQIYVLDQGRIAEQGSHQSLLTRQGPYAHYFGVRADLAVPPDRPANQG